MKTHRWTQALVVAALAMPACAGGREGTAPGAAGAPAEFAGLAVLPPEIRPPGPETAVGHVAVTLENRSGEAIPFDRIGAPELLGSGARGEAVGGFHFLRRLADFEEPKGSLEPGGRRTYLLPAVRVGGDGPAEVRARAWLKVDEERWQAVASDPVAFPAAAWPGAAALRRADLEALAGTGGGPHVHLEIQGADTGLELLEARPDGTAAVLLSRFGPGDRSRAGLHASTLDAAERAALLDALRAAPLETWTPPAPGRRPGPSDQAALTLFVAAGPRAIVVHGMRGDLHAAGLEPLLRHLDGLRTGLSKR
jgi:hypothetical protein